MEVAASIEALERAVECVEKAKAEIAGVGLPEVRTYDLETRMYLAGASFSLERTLEALRVRDRAANQFGGEMGQSAHAT